ncbi:hypothetical protein Q1695_002042 [Nippostrongylus brasiliensis]|nr:hypothetical protein Q1695_002042 [Nippostrongylus brasiliensis]
MAVSPRRRGRVVAARAGPADTGIFRLPRSVGRVFSSRISSFGRFSSTYRRSSAENRSTVDSSLDQLRLFQSRTMLCRSPKDSF